MNAIMYYNKNEKLFFTSDTHFGHRNIIKYCQRPFSSVDEMDEMLISNWNSVVEPDAIVFHLGDFAMGGPKEWDKILQRLNGRIFLIAGNHDLKTVSKGITRFEDVAMQIVLNIKGQRIYLNHYPFLCYSGVNHNAWQLFGHVHSNTFNDNNDSPRLKMLLPTQYDVGVDYNNFTPVSFNQIKKIIKKQVEVYDGSCQSTKE